MQATSSGYDREIKRQTRSTIGRLTWVTAILVSTSVMLGSGCILDQKKNSVEQVWRTQTVSLRAVGFVLDGLELREGEWQGTGVWVAKGLLATNAHIAMRALYIRGEDDKGRTFEFNRLYSLDIENDLAIIGARPDARQNRTDIKPVVLAPRPHEPKDLRTVEVLSVGNTAGLGLSVYRGRIVNVHDVNGVEKVIHDSSVSQGSSGAPLFRLTDGVLLGINHSINAELRFSFAIPAWKLADVVAEASKRQGVALEEVFAWDGLMNVPIEPLAQTHACLGPGEGLQVPLQVQGETDVAYAVVPEKEGQEMHLGLAFVNNGETPVRSMLDGPASGAYTILNGGQVRLLVGNVDEDETSRPVCVQVVAARIAWERRLH